MALYKPMGDIVDVDDTPTRGCYTVNDNWSILSLIFNPFLTDLI